MGKRLAIILGVRPHYIKAVTLRHLLSMANIDVTYLDIRQHYDNDLRGVFLSEYGLDVVELQKSARHFQSSFEFFMDATRGVREWLAADGADVTHLLVMGDAYPALVGALAASCSGRRLIHLEAGIRRVGNEREHWNCALVDILSQMRFCCFPSHVSTLSNEGLGDGTVLIGDIFAPWVIYETAVLADEVQEDTASCLVTIHRPQNCGRAVVEGILNATRKRALRVNWIAHPRIAAERGIIESFAHTTLLCAQSHRDVLRQIMQAGIVITDSGGLARESMILGKRTIIVHEHGMWADAIQYGAAVKCSGTLDSVLDAIDSVLEKHDPTLGRQLFVRPGGPEQFVQSILNDIDGVGV